VNQSSDGLAAFRWEVQPQAGALIAELLARVLALSPAGQALAKRMLAETGTRLVDWVDHLVLADDAGLEQRLLAAGFALRPQSAALRCFQHDGGLFPDVLLVAGGTPALAILVESVVDFLAAHDRDAPIAGAPLAPVRMAVAWSDGAELRVVERHGHPGYHLVELPPERLLAAQRHLDAFRTRRRDLADDAAGFAHARTLIDRAIAEVGVDRTCAAFFAAEREYWQRRNRAARLQKARQDALGLGWANHDHHTYRSSRHCFTAMIALFERLGFRCRERFYPGHNAGWGAQVLEQANTGIVIFADVDMSEEEVRRDFSHEPFPADPRRPLGTVGLWCGLHGESFLQAGMHHLEATFDFEAVRPQLEAAGIHLMAPFTDYPHLRQCFTEGDHWHVADERSHRLLKAGLITMQQDAQFCTRGAIGSHLEILERNQGFKGFNQDGVDRIIAGTDPRRQQ
jgi:hypothetical protein